MSSDARIGIRPPHLPAELPAIQAVNQQAFGRPGPGIFVRLLSANQGTTARVAVRDGALIGYVIFTPVEIERLAGALTGMGLGELAVLPAWQRQGVGTQLVTAGLDLLRAASVPFVIVVGHPTYYPRFGFVSGSRLGLRCQWEKVADEAFMALCLDPGAMRGVEGVARFRGIP